VETASAVLGRLHRRPRRGSCALPGFYEASKLSSLREEPREEGVQRVGRKPKRELAFGRF
jgi:hypothetical protein